MEMVYRRLSVTSLGNLTNLRPIFMSYRNHSVGLQCILFGLSLYNIDLSWLMAFSYFSISTSLLFSLNLISQLGSFFTAEVFKCGLWVTLAICCS